jgi:hypothetical protein
MNWHWNWRIRPNVLNAVYVFKRNYLFQIIYRKDWISVELFSQLELHLYRTLQSLFYSLFLGSTRWGYGVGRFRGSRVQRFRVLQMSTAAGLKSVQSNREINFEKTIFRTNPTAGKKTAGLIEIETLILCYRRVGHRADQYRRARWPALLSQLCVSYESLTTLKMTERSDIHKYSIFTSGLSGLGDNLWPVSPDNKF